MPGPIAPMCMHCDRVELRRFDERLERVPLRELDVRLLTDAGGHGLWGDSDDSRLRHFLPRLLESVVTGPAWDAAVEVLGRDLPNVEWRSWPEPEIAAIRSFFAPALGHALTRTPTSTPRPTDVLAAARAFGLPIAEWIDQSPAAQNADAVRLASFIVDGLPRLPPEERTAVEVWLAKPEVLRVLENAFFDPAEPTTSGGPAPASLSLAAEIVRLLLR